MSNERASFRDTITGATTGELDTAASLSVTPMLFLAGMCMPEQGGKLLVQISDALGPRQSLSESQRAAAAKRWGVSVVDAAFALQDFYDARLRAAEAAGTPHVNAKWSVGVLDAKQEVTGQVVHGLQQVAATMFFRR